MDDVNELAKGVLESCLEEVNNIIVNIQEVEEKQGKIVTGFSEDDAINLGYISSKELQEIRSQLKYVIQKELIALLVKLNNTNLNDKEDNTDIDEAVKEESTDKVD